MFRNTIYCILSKLDVLKSGDYLRFRGKIIFNAICNDIYMEYHESPFFLQYAQEKFPIRYDLVPQIPSEYKIRELVSENIINFINNLWVQKPKVVSPSFEDIKVSTEDLSDFMNDRPMSDLMVSTIALGMEVYVAKVYSDLELPF